MVLKNPYMINSADDLVALSNAVSQGVTYAGTFFKLGGNISLSGLSWTSIGVWGEDELGLGVINLSEEFF